MLKRSLRERRIPAKRWSAGLGPRTIGKRHQLLRVGLDVGVGLRNGRNPQRSTQQCASQKGKKVFAQ
jgi:hypothetical protein